jgi:hypothetical protein
MRHSIERENFVWLFAEDLHQIVDDDLHNSMSIGGRRPAPSRRDDGAARSWRDRDALDLDQDRRVGKAGHGDGGAGGKILAENLSPQLGHARGIARVGDEHRHGDQIGKFRIGFGQGLIDVAEGLPALRLEIPGERAAIVGLGPRVARNVDRARGTGDDNGRGKRTLLLPSAAHEGLLH